MCPVSGDLNSADTTQQPAPPLTATKPVSAALTPQSTDDSLIRRRHNDQSGLTIRKLVSSSMNGIDRVFVSALNTVKRLPSSPSSPKPPLDDRLLLYGLFKQSMEGDIPESMYRTLSIEPMDEEEEANREKTEAWAKQRGTTKTEAKKLYITTLIRSMRQYGSKTDTARSLIDELEFVWNQVNGNNDDHDSPMYSRSNSGSRPPHDRLEAEEDEDEGLHEDVDDEELARALPNVYRTAPPSPSKANQATGLEPQRITSGQAAFHIPSLSLPRAGTHSDEERWRAQVELSLQHIRAELASVRESLLLTSPSHSSLLGLFTGGASGLNDSSSSSFMSVLLTRTYRILRFSLYVGVYDLFLLAVVWLFFRRRGDARAKSVEEWVKRLWNWGVLKLRVRIRTDFRSLDDRR